MLIGWASTGWCPSTGRVCWSLRNSISRTVVYTDVRLLGVMLTGWVLCGHCLWRETCHSLLWVWCRQAAWLLGPVILLGISIPSGICL